MLFLWWSSCLEESKYWSCCRRCHWCRASRLAPDTRFFFPIAFRILTRHSHCACYVVCSSLCVSLCLSVRSAADIVLLSPGLGVVTDAILESRKIFQRMRNYVLYTLSATIRVSVFFLLLTVIFNFYFPAIIITIMVRFHPSLLFCSPFLPTLSLLFSRSTRQYWMTAQSWLYPLTVWSHHKPLIDGAYLSFMHKPF